MIVAYDLDGTISADPTFHKAVMDGLRAAGHQVHIVTGSLSDGPATKEDLPVKAAYLRELGVGDSYDHLAVVDGPHEAIAGNKVSYMRAVGATHLVDNREANVQAAVAAGFTAQHHLSPKGATKWSQTPSLSKSARRIEGASPISRHGASRSR